MRYFLSAACLIFSCHLVGQSAGMHFSVGGGFQFGLKKPKAQALVQPLMISSLSCSTLAIHGHYQWRSRFGLGFMLNLAFPQKNGLPDLTQELERQYPNDFVTARLTGTASAKGVFNSGSQLCVSASYLLVNKTWKFFPKLLVGLSSYPLAGAQVELKRRDSNERSIMLIKRVENENGDINEFSYHENICFGLGATLQRKIWKRFSVYVSADVISFVNNPYFKISVADQVSGLSTSEVVSNRSLSHLLYLHAGVVFFTPQH